MCERRVRRSSCCRSFINPLLRHLEHLHKVRVVDALPLHEIDIAPEELLQLAQKSEIWSAQSPDRSLRQKLHHKIEIALLRIERPFDRGAEDREAFHPVLFAQRPQLGKPLRHEGW